MPAMNLATEGQPQELANRIGKLDLLCPTHQGIVDEAIDLPPHTHFLQVAFKDSAHGDWSSTGSEEPFLRLRSI